MLSAGNGYLSVSAAPSRGLVIVVDGSPRGYAPKRIPLSYGEHLVELRQGSETLLSQTVVVGTEHDRRRPLRIAVPADSESH